MPKLSQYGARIIQTDGIPTVEMIDPNDNARHRYQYRRTTDGGIERRVLRADSSLDLDGSPWETMSEAHILSLHANRGSYHPILDGLGL